MNEKKHIPFGKAIKAAAILALKPLAKAAKPYLRKWAIEKLIPFLKKHINIGKWDKQVDDTMEKAILQAINKM